MKAEIKETNTFKGEIMTDFKGLKKQLIDMEKDLETKRVENETYKTNLIDLKDQIKRKDNLILDIKQDNNQFVWGVVHALFSIKTRFESYHVVQDRVDSIENAMMQTLKREIDDPERCKGLSFEEKKEAIRHLIHLISDVTATLHSENKSLLDSNIEVKELKRRLEENRLKYETELDNLTREKVIELNQLQKEYEEKYNMYMDSSKYELKELEDKLKEEISNLKYQYGVKNQEWELLDEELKDYKDKLENQMSYSSLLKQILISLLFRTEELAFQKELVKKEYFILSDQFSFYRNEAEKLKSFVENSNDRLNLKSMKDSLMSHNESHKNLSMSLSELEQNNIEESNKIIGLSKWMKFRKSVIAILAMNRFKKFKDGYYGKNLSRYKWFREINFSSDSHYKEISKKIRLISIPDAFKNDVSNKLLLQEWNYDRPSLSPKYYNRLETISNCDSYANNENWQQTIPKKLYDGDFDTQNTISAKKTKNSYDERENDRLDENIEKDLISIVDSIIDWQNQINKNRFRVVNDRKTLNRSKLESSGYSMLKIVPNYNLSDFYENISQLVGAGLRPIRHFMQNIKNKALLKLYIKNISNYIDPLPYSVQYLIFVFCSKLYVCKEIFDLESAISSMQKFITQNQYKLSCSDTQLQSLGSKISSLEKELISSKGKWEQYEGLINSLKKEKTDMVERSKYDQLMEEIRSMQYEFNDIKNSKNSLAKQMQAMAQQEGDNSSKLSELNENLFAVTQKYERIKKEKEMVEIELKSINNVLQQKEIIISELSNEKTEEQTKAGEITKTIEKLRQDREALIKDNTTLQKW